MEKRKKSFKSLADSKKVRIFASQKQKGALAHLARALDWQSKGDEFESRMLHKTLKSLGYAKVSFFCIAYFVFLSIFVEEMKGVNYVDI